jgi:hypothetical protein
MRVLVLDIGSRSIDAVWLEGERAEGQLMAEYRGTHIWSASPNCAAWAVR